MMAKKPTKSTDTSDKRPVVVKKTKPAKAVLPGSVAKETKQTGRSAAPRKPSTESPPPRAAESLAVDATPPSGGASNAKAQRKNAIEPPARGPQLSAAEVAAGPSAPAGASLEKVTNQQHEGAEPSLDPAPADSKPTAEGTPAESVVPKPEVEHPPSEQPLKPVIAVEPIREPEPEPEPQPIPEPAPEFAPPVHYHEPRPSLYIIQITPEMAPIAKVGGLADVVFGLTRELAIRGNHVEIILPKYDNLRYDHILGMQEVYKDLWVPWYDGAIHCTVYFSFVHDRKCFFIEPHSHDNFFNRGSLYGFKDDVQRFAFFSRAAAEFMWKSGKHPDIIHCHDWQTALVPVFLYELYQPLGMHHPRVCLTIHNFKHQGVTGPELLTATGLHRPGYFMTYERFLDNQHPGAMNLLKGGIVYSNFITTVSPRYAFETKDQGQGFGLEPTLHTHHMKYGGVVNGIDYDVWNPEIDHHIPVRYGPESIDGKYDNKRALRHRLMLADNEKPIVAFIGRLDPQKGLELVRHAIFYSLEHGAQFVLLGSSPDQGINADFWGLKQMLNDSPDCHLEIGFDEDLSHLIYAGADMMLVPSQFEPCGLTQLIALRYGTIPVVRTIGGLADTVFDKDHSLRPLHERNGYSFETYDAQGLESALGRAIACFYEYPEHFRELMKNAMRADYSWNHPGQDYLNIYDFIRNR